MPAILVPVVILQLFLTGRRWLKRRLPRSPLRNVLRTVPPYPTISRAFPAATSSFSEPNLARTLTHRKELLISTRTPSGVRRTTVIQAVLPKLKARKCLSAISSSAPAEQPPGPHMKTTPPLQLMSLSAASQPDYWRRMQTETITTNPPMRLNMRQYRTTQATIIKPTITLNGTASFSRYLGYNWPNKLVFYSPANATNGFWLLSLRRDNLD